MDTAGGTRRGTGTKEVGEGVEEGVWRGTSFSDSRLPSPSPHWMRQPAGRHSPVPLKLQLMKLMN